MCEISSRQMLEIVVKKYCAEGRFDLAFEVEHHDKLNKLTTDWLVKRKLTTPEAQTIYINLRTKWSMRRKIDLSVWLGFAEKEVETAEC
jgi:hypothetical protein